MADNYNIYKFCQQCKGTGKITINDEAHDSGPPEEVDCSKCNGTGQIFWGQMFEQE